MFYGQQAGSTDPIKVSRSAEYDWLKIKANPLNGGNVYFGTSSDVSRAASTTDTNSTCGYLLDAGQELPLDKKGNINTIWYICDSSTDIWHYVGQKWSSTD